MSDRIWIAVTFGKPRGRGFRGCTHTFCWWRAEPQREPFTPPTGIGGGTSAEDARIKAEDLARRWIGRDAQVIELPPMWARAARFSLQGDPPWPAERSTSREVRDRAFADSLDEHRREELAAHVRRVGYAAATLETSVFLSHGFGAVVRFAIVGREGGAVVVEHGAHGAHGDVDRVRLDAAELVRDGRAWSKKHRTYFYAPPPEKRTRTRHAHGRPGPRAAAGSAPNTAQAYAALGLPDGAPEADIKRAFRRLALETHPDRGGSAEDFIAVLRARDAALAAVASR
ncbi:DnaJ domain-containing protein [Sorangium sp. So ce590]|uniref:DnaJ domain-containing protein n=1 Tax=Sorangium sp. So ce590 TaxID=3133317 RepID=UPI003F603581